jgi:hypothetical protein
MKKIVDGLRFVIISPEVCCGLLILLLLLTFPEISLFVAKYIFSSEVILGEDSFVWLVIPITSLALTYKLGDSILNPEDKESRKKLKEWPNYWMLKNRIYYSLLISVISLLGTLGAWYYALSADIWLGVNLILIFWAISLISLSTVSIAKLTIKDIIY